MRRAILQVHCGEADPGKLFSVRLCVGYDFATATVRPNRGLALLGAENKFWVRLPVEVSENLIMCNVTPHYNAFRHGWSLGRTRQHEI